MTLLIFSANRSRLLRKRIMEVSRNHLLLLISSKRLSASVMRLVFSSSYSTWSYSLMAATNRTAVTFSKQWIHFFLSFLCSLPRRTS